MELLLTNYLSNLPIQTVWCTGEASAITRSLDYLKLANKTGLFCIKVVEQ